MLIRIYHEKNINQIHENTCSGIRNDFPTGLRRASDLAPVALLVGFADDFRRFYCLAARLIQAVAPSLLARDSAAILARLTTAPLAPSPALQRPTLAPRLPVAPPPFHTDPAAAQPLRAPQAPAPGGPPRAPERIPQNLLNQTVPNGYGPAFTF